MENQNELYEQLQKIEEKAIEDAEELRILRQRCEYLEKIQSTCQSTSKGTNQSDQIPSCSMNHQGNSDEETRSECQNRNLGCSVNPTLGFKFDDVIGAFKTFKGDGKIEILSWVNHFEDQCNEFNFSEMQRFILAKRLMKEDAKLFLEFESKATSWRNFKHELICEFNTKMNSALVHQKLRARKKKENESAMKYLYEMLSIASVGGVDVAATITYTVDGLPGSTQSKKFMYEAKTIAEFK